MAIENKNSLFDWLRDECLQIQSQQFHIFDALSFDDFCYVLDDHRVNLHGDYCDFLKEFGWGKLFTDHSDAPAIAIYPLKEYRRHDCADGKTYVGFADRGNKSFCFEEQQVLSGYPCTVYMLKGKSAKEVHLNFSEWLKTSYDIVKAGYSKTKWMRIVAGPKPFSEEEMQVVEARRNFSWKLIGFSDDGGAKFEVTNNSNRRLPFLSIGIQDKARAVLIGGVWLNVAHIQPGTTAIVIKDCYKDQISSDQLMPFHLPEPIPEKKERYWEFTALLN
jgi:hypothetical protein